MYKQSASVNRAILKTSWTVKTFIYLVLTHINTIYIYIKEFRFFHFQFNPFNNLTHWKQKSYFPKITLFRWPSFRSSVTHYCLKHLHRNSCDFLLNSTCQLLNCVGCWSFEDLRFQRAQVTQSGDAQNGVDFFQWPLSLPQYSRLYVLFLHYRLSSLVKNQ